MTHSANNPGAGAYTRQSLEAMDIDDLDRLAFGVAGGDVVALKPEQLHIVYPDDLLNPQARFEKEGMRWANSVDLTEPVEVSVDNDGRLCLEDGHHRWFAAKATRRTLQGRMTIKGKPIERILARQANEANPQEDSHLFRASMKQRMDTHKAWRASVEEHLKAGRCAETLLDEVVAKLDEIGNGGLSDFWDLLEIHRPDLFPALLARLPDGPELLEQLKWLGTVSGAQPWRLMPQCMERARQADTAHPDNAPILPTLLDFTAHTAIGAAVDPQMQDSGIGLAQHLDVVLGMPEGKVLYPNWTLKILEVAYHTTRANSDLVAVALDKLIAHGIGLQTPQDPGGALTWIFRYYGGTDATPRDRLLEGVLDALLDRGMEWEGLGLDQDNPAWALIQQHPRAVSRQLGAQARLVRPGGADEPTPRRKNSL
jgi:hypothetical protein